MSQIPGTEGVLSQADPPSSDSASQPQAYKPPLPEAPPVMDEVSPSSTSSFEMLDTEAPPPPYQPVKPHWFYCGRADDGTSWLPFSREDSGKLEQAHADVGTRAGRVVAVEGERYDVRVGERRRHAVYWDQAPSEVRRCTWFYKGDKDLRFFPYGEDMAARLELQVCVFVGGRGQETTSVGKATETREVEPKELQGLFRQEEATRRPPRSHENSSRIKERTEGVKKRGGSPLCRRSGNPFARGRGNKGRFVTDADSTVPSKKAGELSLTQNDHGDLGLQVLNAHVVRNKCWNHA
ncbi:unnamed protein product [Arctogadus glacialis]